MLYKKFFYIQPGLKLLPNKWDLLALFLVLSLLIALAWGGSLMSAPFQLGEPIPIFLSPNHLPLYALETIVRMLIALLCSFIFSLVVATLAAKSHRAGTLLIPIIDILQSVPILSYLSISIVAFIALFPNSLLGPECAAIFVVFTSQVWNMTLSFYQSLRTVPNELSEAAKIYQLSGWQKFWRIEVPFAMPGLLWNAMMSMSGGWFFIVASEAISVANQQISLPGIGSYIALAIETQNLSAIFYAIVTMLIVIFLYDQVLFRPLVAWAEKFRITDMSDEGAHSWVLNLLQRTRVLQIVKEWVGLLTTTLINARVLCKMTRLRREHISGSRDYSLLSNIAWYSIVSLMGLALLIGLGHFIYATVPFSETSHVFVLAFYTGMRVFVMIILCSFIWVPVGILVGLRPRLSQYIQPLAQFLAAFPANLFFPIFVVAIVRFHLNVEIWAAPLMVLGTQWYILFNVIAGASVIPKELKLAAQNMQLKGFLAWKRLLIPAVFPYYVTGAITAAGGAWNASIVAEIIQWGNTILKAQGLGAYITQSTTTGDFERIALGVVVMAFVVTGINMVFWRRLYKFAESRYALN